MLTILQNGDFPSGRLMFQPEAQDIASCIDVAVVDRSAIATLPASYSKRTHTFRAADGDSPAARARLGTPSLVSFYEHGSVPAGLVAEHVSKAAPARIEDGFRHLRLRKLGGVHVADDDQTMISCDIRRLHVELVTPRVCDLGIYRADTALVSGSLGYSKLRLIFAVVPHRLNLAAIAASCERVQAQIDPDLSSAGGEIICHLADERDEPLASRILDERADFEVAVDVSGLPEPETALEVKSFSAIYFQRTGDEGYPAEGTLAAEAGSEAWAAPVSFTRRSELTADGLNSVRMNPEFSGAAGNEAYEIEGRRPPNVKASFAAPLCLALRSDAEVPHLITGYRISVQQPIARLNTELEGDRRHHGSLLLTQHHFKVSRALAEGARQS